MKAGGAQWAAWTGGECVQDGLPGELSTDTRSLKPGEWFLALTGPRFDGNAHLQAARDAGCAGVIAQRLPSGWDRGAVLVEDGLLALQQAAASLRSELSIPVVGLTGSVGKTTTRSMASCALRSLGHVHATKGNLNNHIGLPLTLLSTPEEARAVVLEMGMSAPGEIRLLRSIAQPTHRLITNIRAAHLQGAGTLAGVRACKAELFEDWQPGDRVLLPLEEDEVCSIPLPAELKRMTYGRSPHADVRLERCVLHPEDLSTEVWIQTPRGSVHCRLPAPGEHLAEAACAAVAIASSLGLTAEEIRAGLSRWKPVGMRMALRRLPGGQDVILDCYNASPASTLAALKVLCLPGSPRRLALLGDMLELGSAEAEGHRRCLQQALDSGVEWIGTVGPRYQQAAEALSLPPGRWLHADSARALGQLLKDVIAEGDRILIKGSRSMRMEEALRALESTR